LRPFPKVIETASRFQSPEGCPEGARPSARSVTGRCAYGEGSGLSGEGGGAGCRGAVSVRVVGGGVGGPGLKPRNQVAGVGRVRKKRDSFAGALLAQGNVGSLKYV